MAAYLHGVRLGLLLAGAGRSPAGSTRPSPTFLSRDGSVGKKPSTRSPDRLLHGWYGGPGTPHQDPRPRVGPEISCRGTKKQGGQRTVAAASHPPPAAPPLPAASSQLFSTPYP